MTRNMQNCTRFHEQMVDAATGGLSVARRRSFDAHVDVCDPCREEFRRVQTLLQAIDQGVTASVAVEPSPQLVANIRQTVGGQVEHALFWWQPSRWLIVAGACAALALFVVRILKTPNRVISNPAPQSLIAPSALPAVAVTPPSRTLAVESAKNPPLRSLVRAVARRSSMLTLTSARSGPAVPEVIVEPGQMQALLRFAVAMQRGQIDGAKFLADQKRAAEPLEIEPLAIVPLNIAPLDAEASPPASSSGEAPEQKFVAGRSD